MEIIRSNKTKINDVEFKKLSFGKTFTDHMFLCEFKDGKWNSGYEIKLEKVVDWQHLINMLLLDGNTVTYNDLMTLLDLTT